MGIFSNIKNKNKDRLVLILNIGSSSIEGALVYTQTSGIPKIVFSATEPIPLEEKVDTDRFLSQTIQSLEALVKKISLASTSGSSAYGAPESVFCVLSSPLHVSQTRTINFKKNTPFVFNAKLAESLVQKEINLFTEEHLVKDATIQNSTRTIELKTIKTLLNGYETSNPFNQNTKEVEMTIFISISEERVLKSIEDTIGRYFHPDKSQIRFSSFTLASFAVVRDLFSAQENFLLVDVGGEVTNISMVKNNMLCESISFPFGRNFIIREAAPLLNSTLSEADSLISLFKDEHATEPVNQKLSPVMDTLKTKWLKSFQESTANLSNDISIPSVIYLTADSDVADFFCQAIQAEQFNQYILTESKFQITLLNSPVFKGMVTREESIMCGPNILIDSIYINRFMMHDSRKSLKKKEGKI